MAKNRNGIVNHAKSLSSPSAHHLARILAADVLTTGMAAKVCRVAARTMSAWIDKGIIKGYKIPGSKIRRVFKDDMIRFMKEHGIPLRELGQNYLNVMCLTNRYEIVQTVKVSFGKGAQIGKEPSLALFVMGMVTNQPRVIIVDWAMGESCCTEAIEASKTLPLVPLVYGVTTEDTQPERLLCAGCNEVFTWPDQQLELMRAILKYQEG